MQDLFDQMSRDSGMMVDTMERDEAFVVTADLPGFEPADVDVSLRGGVLEIVAASETGDETETATYVRRERTSRSLRRSIQIPGEIDTDAITAELTNGVLTVTLPKLVHSDEDDVSVAIE